MFGNLVRSATIIAAEKKYSSHTVLVRANLHTVRTQICMCLAISAETIQFKVHIQMFNAETAAAIALYVGRQKVLIS
jgi:hypothetical protein